jgi:hypothetical protein
VVRPQGRWRRGRRKAGGEEKSRKARFALGHWEALALDLARTRREGCE